VASSGFSSLMGYMVARPAAEIPREPTLTRP